MNPVLRWLRTLTIILSPALCVACTEVVQGGSTDSNGSSSPFDTGPGGGTPDVGGPAKDTGGSDATADTGPFDSSVGADTAQDSGQDPDVETPPDAQADDTADTGPTTTCEELEADFAAALTQATGCAADADCDLRHTKDIAGCACDVWITPAGVGPLDDLVEAYAAGGCVTCEPPTGCPALGNPRCVASVCTASTKPVSCPALADAYKSEVSKAKPCAGSEDCRLLTESALACGCPVYVNENYDTTKMKSLASQYHTAQCSPGEGCPACGEALVGVCSNGKCTTKTKAP